jgi:hypothetical protein
VHWHAVAIGSQLDPAHPLRRQVIMTRQHYDKRTLRRHHAADFVRAIAAYEPRARGAQGQAHEAPEAQNPSSGAVDRNRVRIWLRKRPIFPSEEQLGEFECFRRHGNAMAVTHQCTLSSDLTSAKMTCYTCDLPVLSEDNAEAMRQMNVAQVCSPCLPQPQCCNS